MLSIQLIGRITLVRDGHQSELIYAILLALAIWPESERMSSEFYYRATFIVAMIFLNSYLKVKQ